jgi:hypothetical protein
VKKSSHDKFCQSKTGTPKLLARQDLHFDPNAAMGTDYGLGLALMTGNGGSLGMISSKRAIALTFCIALLFVAVMNRDIVSEQGTLAMLGTGLVGLATLVRRNLTVPEESSKE